jgi:hypothetical protein
VKVEIGVQVRGVEPLQLPGMTGSNESIANVFAADSKPCESGIPINAESRFRAM